MTNNILPTANEEWGMWGTSGQNGYDQQLTWNATSRILAAEFKLTPEQTRNLLDARFGRHLADDLSFIKGGPDSAEKIEAHIKARLEDHGWNRYFRKAVSEARQAA